MQNNKTKWIILSLVFVLLFFGLFCLADFVAVKGVGVIVLFLGLIGLQEIIWP